MKNILLYMTLATMVGLSGCRSSGNPQAEADAVASAEAWRALVDSGRYAESWEKASGFFQGAVGKERWIQTMQAARKPFGKNLSRKLRSARYRTALPGAPDGEYVVIQFKASFKHKKSAVETITPSLDQDGQWRVSGYYMK